MFTKRLIRLCTALVLLGASLIVGCTQTDPPPKDPSLVPPPGQAADDLPGAQQKKK